MKIPCKAKRLCFNTLPSIVVSNFRVDISTHRRILGVLRVRNAGVVLAGSSKSGRWASLSFNMAVIDRPYTRAMGIWAFSSFDMVAFDRPSTRAMGFAPPAVRVVRHAGDGLLVSSLWSSDMPRSCRPRRRSIRGVVSSSLRRIRVSLASSDTSTLRSPHLRVFQHIGVGSLFPLCW